MHEILHFVQNDKHTIFMIATQSRRGRCKRRIYRFLVAAVDIPSQ